MSPPQTAGLNGRAMHLPHEQLSSTSHIPLLVVLPLGVDIFTSIDTHLESMLLVRLAMRFLLHNPSPRFPHLCILAHQKATTSCCFSIHHLRTHLGITIAH